MLTLADINALPNDPSEDHLRSIGLLPQPPPTPSIVPHLGAGEKIPALSPVTSAAPAAPSDWRAKLATASKNYSPEADVAVANMHPFSTPVHPNASPLPPLSPVAAPEMGAPATSEMPASAESATPGVNFPKLAPLNFKERQALPTTSEGVAPGSKESFEAQLARLQDQKANPWGSPENHPGLLGKIGHYASRIGNIAGDIIAPATMANVPGTDINKKIEERGLENQIAKAGAEREREKTGESERELRSAEATEAEARAKKLAAEGSPDILQDAAGNAVGWRDDKGALHSLTEEGTPQAIKDITEKWEGKSAAKPQKENLEQGLAGAVQDAIDKGEDPEESAAVKSWGDAINKFKPAKEKDVNTSEDLKHRIALAVEKHDVAGAAQLEKELMDLNPDAKARLAESQASLAATQEQRRITNEEHQEKEGRTLVRVRDEKTGQTFVEPLSKAKADGFALDSMEEVPAGEKAPIQDARLVMKVINKKGDKPENKGVLQLVDELDKDGKLGVASSRLNSFLAGGVGTLPGDDPRIIALLDKADLAMTLSMKAHFGVSGGRSPQMLEHFLNLANAKKMDGPALRGGFKAVNDYMKDRAEMPPTEAGGGGGGKEGVQVHNGFEYTKGDDGQWHKGKAVQP